MAIYKWEDIFIFVFVDLIMKHEYRHRRSPLNKTGFLSFQHIISRSFFEQTNETKRKIPIETSKLVNDQTESSARNHFICVLFAFINHNNNNQAEREKKMFFFFSSYFF